MPELTPGETAYAAYWPALGTPPPVPWDGLSPVVHTAWERAAQAVLEARASLCPICAAKLERLNAPGHTDMARLSTSPAARPRSR